MAEKEKVIFVADDYEKDRELFNEALLHTSASFKIIYAQDGQELLKNIENYYAQNQAFPKMILLDINISAKDRINGGPEKKVDDDSQKPSGMETLKMIKSHFLYKTIPVLVLSANKGDERMVEAYSRGANSFLIKPVTQEEFEAFVKTLSAYWFELAEI